MFLKNKNHNNYVRVAGDLISRSDQVAMKENAEINIDGNWDVFELIQHDDGRVSFYNRFTDKYLTNKLQSDVYDIKQYNRWDSPSSGDQRFTLHGYQHGLF